MPLNLHGCNFGKHRVDVGPHQFVGPPASDSSPVLGALEATTERWVYRLGRRCATDFIALLDQLLRTFPSAPGIVVICDNDSINPAAAPARSAPAGPDGGLNRRPACAGSTG
jgi:hypothetical protein